MNRRKIVIIITLLLVAVIYNLINPFVVHTYTDGIIDYCRMSNGTWKADEYTYKYRLEITGRVHAAKGDTTYVYLSNIPNIDFHSASMASGLSSNLNAYFPVEEAILVDITWDENES